MGPLRGKLKPHPVHMCLPIISRKRFETIISGYFWAVGFGDWVAVGMVGLGSFHLTLFCTAGHLVISDYVHN